MIRLTKQEIKNSQGDSEWIEFDISTELFKFFENLGLNKEYFIIKHIQNHQCDFEDYLYFMLCKDIYSKTLNENASNFWVGYEEIINRYGEKRFTINKKLIPLTDMIRGFWAHIGVLGYCKGLRTNDMNKPVSHVIYWIRKSYLENSNCFEFDESILTEIKDLNISNSNEYTNNNEVDYTYNHLLQILGNDISYDKQHIKSSIDAKYDEFIETNEPYKFKKVYYLNEQGKIAGFEYKAQYFNQLKKFQTWQRFFMMNKSVKYTIDSQTGRLYTYFTYLPKIVRDTFLLDNEPIEELDISNCHPLLFCVLIDRYIKNIIINASQQKEVDEYRYLTENGIFYNTIMAEYQAYKLRKNLKNIIPDDCFKQEFFAAVFFSNHVDKNGKPVKNNPLCNFFKEKFPFLTDIINSYKAKNYKNMAKELQKLEAEIIIKGICKKLINSDIKVISCHDGLYINPKNIAKASEIAESVFGEYGLKVTIKNKSVDYRVAA